MLRDWERYLVANKFSANVIAHYPAYGRGFARAWQVPLTTLTTPDVQAYVDQLSVKCKWLRVHGCDRKIAVCPQLQGRNPASCKKYEPLQPSGVLSHLVALGNLYEWTVRVNGAPRNIITPVTSDYLERHRAFWDERRRNPNRRILKDEEVVRLVHESTWPVAIVCALMGGGFLRIHEAMKLRVTPEFLDLDARTIKIPGDSAYGAKRQGINHTIWLNDAMLDVVKRYLVWREVVVKRDSRGRPRTDRLCLTRIGNAWSTNGFQGNFKKSLHEECIRLGFMTGRETKTRERINPHCFRAWACTWAIRHGADSTELRFCKGDRQAGAVDMYVNLGETVEKLFRAYGPVLSQ